MSPKDQNYEYGQRLAPEVKNVINLTLAFTKAVGGHQKDLSDNLVVSPYNALACLAMVAKGADNETRAEMAKALFGVEGADLDAAADAYAALNTKILENNKGQVELTTANGIWTNKDIIALRQSFADDMKKTFGADISAEDYKDAATINKINDWADKNTNGLIKKVLEELSPSDAAVLASALYFKGEWTHKFDKALTEDKVFTKDNGGLTYTPTMHQDFEENAICYLKGADFEAVTMTYGEENCNRSAYKTPTMRLVLVRPSDDSVSARDWLASQATGKIPAWLDRAAFSNAQGSVELPRLDIEQKHDLIPALKDMGISSAFKHGADFTKMVEEKGDSLYVSQVSHDVVFKTDEEGSEAAAVTTAVITLACCPAPVMNIDMKLDRSFVFALQDVKTGAVLFVGAVNKPNKDMKLVKPSGIDPLKP